MKKIFLSVVIPCYNEERNIRLGALENLAHYMQKRSYEWEALIVDDGSSDASTKLVKDFISDHAKFRLIERKHQGKAAAVSAGVLEAVGEYILFTDLDQATPINQVEKLLPKFDEGFDIVIGSRSSDRRGAPFTRLMMARGFMALRNIILNLGIRDTQCGFKIFKRVAARTLFPKLRVYHMDRQANGSTVTAGFDVELLYMAKLHGYTIAEVPVEWHYQETRHVSPLKDSIESLIDLMVIRLNSIRGVYGKG